MCHLLAKLEKLPPPKGMLRGTTDDVLVVSFKLPKKSFVARCPEAEKRPFPLAKLAKDQRTRHESFEVL